MSTKLANRYDVLGLLGEGGMGQVFRVADGLADGRELALKVIKVETHATADQRMRFRAEYRAMTRLRHPNTIEVHDYGTLDDGNHFIAMELVPGRELADVIGGKPMPLAEAYPLLIQLLQALDFVHARGYVHRDIKAANVRVRDDGTLKLMDFGLMGQIGAPSAQKVTGTPGYMAPEVAQGGVITAGSDLYSVGCLAYEMLTGKLPFEGKLMDVVRAHVQTAPIPLRRRRPDAPEALERIVMRMLEKDPTRRQRTAGQVLDELAALAGLAATRESDAQRASFLATGELVGRDEELALLDAALADARAGRGRAVFVAAPAGTGKSRLVQELLLRAKLAGFVVMHGACHDEGMAPFEALATSLRPALPHGTAEEHDRYLPALVRLFPDQAKVDPASVAPAEAAELAAAAIAWVGDLAAREPLLWLMDDLHWADGPTVEVFNQAIRGLTGRAVLAIGTFRDDETPAGSPVWATLEDGSAETLRLRPLAPDAQLALVRAMLPDAEVSPDFAHALDAATGGNPFFLTEVVRSLMEDGHVLRAAGAWRFPADPAVLRPLSSMEATVRRRLGHLSRDARRLLAIAAVLGHEWDTCALRDMTGSGEDALLADLDELVDRHLLDRLGACDFRFPHDRVREVTYAEIPAEMRRALHLRAGEVLEARHGDGAEAHAHELGRHFLLGGDGARAFRYLRVAARQADLAGADAVAVERMREAEAVLAGIDVPDKRRHQVELWYAIGVNAFVTMPEVACEMLGRLLAAYEADPEGVRPLLEAVHVPPAAIYGVLAITAGFCGRPREALALADRAMTLFREAEDPMLAARAFVRGGGLLAAGRIDEAVATARAAAEGLEGYTPEQLGPPLVGARVGAWGLQNAVTFQGVRPDPAIRDRSLAYARENNDENPFTIWMYFGLWPAWTGRQDDAQAFVDMMAQKSRKVGGPPYAWALYVRSYLLWQRGEFALGLEQVDKALIAYPLLRQNALAFHHMLGLRGLLLMGVGRDAEGEAVFTELVAVGREREMGLSIMLGLLGLGMARLKAGHAVEARERYAEVHAMASEGPYRNPLFQARAARGLGQVAMQLGDWDGAAARFAEALAIAERPEQDNLMLQAFLRRDRGKLLQRRGDRAAAEAELTQARAIFQRLRMAHWVHAIGQDLAGAHEVLVPKAEASPEARWQLMRGLM